MGQVVCFFCCDTARLSAFERRAVVLKNVILFYNEDLLYCGVRYYKNCSRLRSNEVPSGDFALVNRVKTGDIVITQDYGLASMCLARRARVLNQNGLECTADNMDALMLRRYENKKLFRAGKHPKGSTKQTKEQDVKFMNTLRKILQESH